MISKGTKGDGAPLLKVWAQPPTIFFADHAFLRLCSRNSYKIKKTSSVLFVLSFVASHFVIMNSALLRDYSDLSNGSCNPSQNILRLMVTS